MRILAPGRLGQITRAPKTFFFLGWVTWLDLVAWPEVTWSQTFKNMCGTNTLTAMPKKRRPSARPFFRYQQNTWVGPTEVVVQKIYAARKGVWGEAGSDLLRDLDYGTTFPAAVPGQWSLRWLTGTLPPFSNGGRVCFLPQSFTIRQYAYRQGCGVGVGVGVGVGRSQ